MTQGGGEDGLKQRIRFRREQLGRRLRAGWEQFWFRAFKTRNAAVLFALGAFAGFGDFIGPFTDHLFQGPIWSVLGWMFKGVAFTLAVIGLIGLARALIRRLRPAADDYELRPARPVASVSGLEGSHDVIQPVTGANGPVALNMGVDAQLDQGRHGVVLLKPPYSWPHELAQAARLAEQAMNPLVVNEQKLGLRTEIDSGFVQGDAPVRLQKTTYFFDRTTNEVLRFDVYAKARNRRVWAGRDHFLCDDELIRLEQASASNQLGGSTIMIDQSGMAYLTRQAATSAESSGLLAPTGSGSFDLARYQKLAVRPGLTFQEFCRREIERELFEETDCVFSAAELKTVLVGFGRYLYRGGKPEVFAVTALRRPVADIRVSRQERLWTEGHEALPLDQLIAWDAGRLAQVSAPLAANVVLLQRFMASDQSAELKAFLAD
ncbi:hypothetical protein ABC365_11790 [Brevundimonas sp. 3P9-tot-E]|uniref:hypothetical protein n=1 Tax=Brevundimonas TaxID=41275 RepID=UPI0034D65DB0